MKTQELSRIATATSFMAVCSWISLPFAVPFTLQTFAVFLVLGVLGGKKGFLAIVLYLLMGAVGVPVFAGFSSGVGVLLGATGGYLFGFLLAALLYWAIEASVTQNPSRITMFARMLGGLLLCYGFGTVWFYWVALQGGKELSLFTVLSWCVFPFVVPDVLKMMLAIQLVPRLRRAVNILPGQRSGSL